MSAKKVNIDKLIDSYCDFNSSNPGLLDDMLREEGYNPEEVEKRGIQKIKHLLFKHQASLRKDSILGLYNKAIAIVQQSTVTTREAIFTLLKQKSPSLQFRNLEILDEDNLRQILNETEVLDLIDKLEKGEL